MMSFIKWFIPTALLLYVLFYFTNSGMVQNVSTQNTSDVEVLTDVLSLGEIRGDYDDFPDSISYFDKEELEANLLYKIVTSQTNHSYDLVVNYVYLDSEGKVTTLDNDIRGVQFEVKYSKNGKMYSSTSKRISLDRLH